MSVGTAPLLALGIVACWLLGACSIDGPSSTDPTLSPSDPSRPRTEATDATVAEQAPTQLSSPPRPGTTWQYQLTEELDLAVEAEVFDVDGDTTTVDQVDALHRRGAYVVCYVSAGSWEEWRDDASSYPSEILGRALEGWPDERWLDIRQVDVILPVLESRLERCAAKGFDAVEFDNVDGWTNDTGFPLTDADQLRFNRALAAVAHRHGLAAGLKNDAEQVNDLVDHFDFAVVEECVRHDECHLYRPFTDAGKAVFMVEYEGGIDEICAEAADIGTHAILKDLDLGPDRRAC